MLSVGRRNRQRTTQPSTNPGSLLAPSQVRLVYLTSLRIPSSSDLSTSSLVFDLPGPFEFQRNETAAGNPLPVPPPYPLCAVFAASSTLKLVPRTPLATARRAAAPSEYWRRACRKVRSCAADFWRLGSHRSVQKREHHTVISAEIPAGSMVHSGAAAVRRTASPSDDSNSSLRLAKILSPRCGFFLRTK